MTQRPFGADELVAVAVGGVVGALCRWLVSVAVPRADAGAWPWATFATNLVGCLALGLLLAWVESRHELWTAAHPRRARLARPMLASGVLGGFTTFSTFSVETVELVDSGHPVAAVAYVVLSVVLGVLLVLLGRGLGGAAFGPTAHDVRADEDL